MVRDDSSSSPPDEEDAARSVEDRSSTNNENAPVENKPTVEADSREQRAVRVSKLMVIGTLIVAALIVGIVTFCLTRGREEREFNNHFEDIAHEIFAVSHHNAKTTYQAIEAFAFTITSFTIYEEVQWPLYTVPHFAERAADLRKLSLASFVAFSPLVSTDNKTTWELHANDNQQWVSEGLKFQGSDAVAMPIPFSIHTELVGAPLENGAPGPFSPLWQMSDVKAAQDTVNYDLLQNPAFAHLAHFTDSRRVAAFSGIIVPEELFGNSAPISDGTPDMLVLQPVFGDVVKDAEIVGHIAAVLAWSTYLANVLHDGAAPVDIVVTNTCDQVITYQVQGKNVIFKGDGDQHDPKYSSHEQVSPFDVIHDSIIDETQEHCEYTMHVYPTQAFYDNHRTNAPAVFTSMVVLIFVLTSLVFVVYDMMVTRRQRKVVTAAARTNQIVSSLFPDAVRDKLMEDAGNKPTKKGFTNAFLADEALNPKAHLKTFLSDTNDDDAAPYAYETKPIAELFPHTTVMFADIAGFTAWSSVREPSQVFTLLETIYSAFDDIARQRRVFKVETVGDCYVAVTGLPEARNDHAVLMCRFARDCMNRMKDLVTKLEVSLGPDTGDLAIRVGIHSGPVTAGVLRGERARFQLFGDTVNTAARMETTGMRNRIHVSPDTADLLMEAGKDAWVIPRQDIVVAKGKGAIQTFWLTDKSATAVSVVQSTTSTEEGTARNEGDDVTHQEGAAAPVVPAIDLKMQRLIDWNCELLLQLLKKIVARRQAQQKPAARISSIQRLEDELSRGGTALSEIVEVIRLPEFNKAISEKEVDPKSIELGEDVTLQMRQFVGVLASLYRDNPFHCYEHASHVTMSVSKLLARIVAPEGDVRGAALHDHTYGITSDPTTQFSVVLSGLIHDVDHRGVPNFVLCREDPNIAAVYNSKSVAEQNSIDLAWNALMDPSFTELRRCIYSDEDELKRFRQLLVNSVMATDIFDKELGLLRKKRWDRAFQDAEAVEESVMDKANRKATIVIEHLIQASDVAHTMQHWHIYRKWNDRLLNEMYAAYRSGRVDKDPCENWYQGELGFFDGYVIPLARKLKDCGVFGVSSDEYLNYALENRREWERKGADVVQAFIEKNAPAVAVESGMEEQLNAAAPPALLEKELGTGATQHDKLRLALHQARTLGATGA